MKIRLIARSLLLIIFTSCGTNVFAQEATNGDNRLAKITKELDCVANRFINHRQISWEDVCYTSDALAGYDTKRQQAVTDALDRFERRSKKEQHRKYKQERYRVDPRRIQQYEQELQHQLRVEADKRSTALKYGYTDYDKIKASLFLMGGYRTNELNWNISGVNGMNPNVKVEYKWTDLQSFQIKSKSQLLFDNIFILEGQVARSWIVEGNNQVSEFDGNDRTMEVTRTRNKADEGDTFDISGGVGIRYNMESDDDFFELKNTWLSLLGGYSYHEQNLSIKDGNQTIDTTGMFDLGPFEGLDSPYEAEWKGPWLGIELGGEQDNFLATVRFEYHFAEYNAEGQINLNENFQQPKSFDHSGDGEGLVFALDMSYKLNPSWELNFNADYQDWEILDGTDRLFLADGSIIQSRLNEVNWTSFALMLGAKYQFN